MLAVVVPCCFLLEKPSLVRLPSILPCFPVAPYHPTATTNSGRARSPPIAELPADYRRSQPVRTSPRPLTSPPRHRASSLSSAPASRHSAVTGAGRSLCSTLSLPRTDLRALSALFALSALTGPPRSVSMSGRRRLVALLWLATLLSVALRLAAGGRPQSGSGQVTTLHHQQTIVTLQLSDDGQLKRCDTIEVK